jgi:hypothetical protein
MHCSKPASSRRSRNQSPKHFEKTGSPRDVSRKVFLPSGVAFDRLLRTLSSGKQGFAYRRARISIAVRSSRAQHPFETPSLSASVDDVDGAIGGDAPRLRRLVAMRRDCHPGHRAFAPEL